MEAIINKIYELYIRSTGICTDTRKLQKGQIYFALKGENFDGNKFANDAIASGALKAIVDDPSYHNEHTILVNDALIALQLLANKRRIANPPLYTLAITGSNGKTTSKELLKSVLATKYRVYATEGNLNNHIGVPLTLLSYPADTQILIVEMGANHRGEIKQLCEIAAPDHGFITNIGKAHLEGFGGEGGVLLGKLELWDYLEANGAAFFVNLVDPTLIHHFSTVRSESLLPISTDSLGVENIELNDFDQLTFRCNILQVENPVIKTSLRGKFQLGNLLAAIAIGYYFKIDHHSIIKSISEFKPAKNRSELIKWQENEVILDAYNANPSSMLASVSSFLHTAYQGKWMILGDMFELGDYAQAEHQALVNYLQEHNGYEKILLIGQHFAQASISSDLIEVFSSREDASKWLESNQPIHKTILIKGSRGVALEKLLHPS